MAAKILVVDDEKDIREVVNMLLMREGYKVIMAGSGTEAIDLVKSGERFSLIIMDIVMPDLSGFKTVSEIREMSNCPVLFLTAKSSDEDKILAYRSGGDDYLTKPFSRVELLLRVEALLKRCDDNDADYTDLNLDDVRRKRVYKNGELIRLTDKEFDLLYLMYHNKGTIYTIQELYEKVWDERFSNTSANTVMVHILNLRKKLEDDFKNPKMIMTAWGKGYFYAGED